MEKGKNSLVQAFIMAGGKSRRFGRDKSLHVLEGMTLIERVAQVLGQQFERVAIIANDQDKYQFTGLDVYPDLTPGLGPIGGIQTALTIAQGNPVFISACDMPFLNLNIIGYMEQRFLETGVDVCLPSDQGRFEPLHSFYSHQCLAPITGLINSGNNKIIDFFNSVRVEALPTEELLQLDPDRRAFFNLNYLEDLEKI